LLRSSVTPTAVHAGYGSVTNSRWTANDVLAKADVVRGHFDDVGPRRLRFAEHGRDIAVELPELLGDVGWKIAAGRAADRAGDVDRVADAKTRRVRDRRRRVARERLAVTVVAHGERMPRSKRGKTAYVGRARNTGFRVAQVSARDQ
jgi:hypothetical protein